MRTVRSWKAGNSKFSGWFCVNLASLLRTVRDKFADCPPAKPAKPQVSGRVLVQFLGLRRTVRGKSRTVRRGFRLRNTDYKLSGGILDLYGGLSAVKCRTVRESRKMPRNGTAEKWIFSRHEASNNRNFSDFVTINLESIRRYWTRWVGGLWVHILDSK